MMEAQNEHFADFSKTLLKKVIKIFLFLVLKQVSQFHLIDLV